MSLTAWLTLAVVVVGVISFFGLVCAAVWIWWWLVARFIDFFQWFILTRWLFRKWVWRNHVAVFRLRWILGVFGYKRPNPSVVLNMTEEGPTTFTCRATNKIGANSRRGWFWNPWGPGSFRQNKHKEHVDGDVLPRPTLRWVEAGYLDEEPDTKMPGKPFPVQCADYLGVEIRRARKRDTKRKRRYFIGEKLYPSQEAVIEAIEAMVEEGSNGEGKRWWRRAG